MIGAKEREVIIKIYQDSRTVFKVDDIALLVGCEKDIYLRKKLRYYVENGELLNIQKGYYTKLNYNPEELACLLYPPTYISLEYVLQKAGVISQFDNVITNVSYLTCRTEIDNYRFHYRQMQGDILMNTAGILMDQNNINIATPERAFLDMLYLEKDFQFENLHILNEKKINRLVSIYHKQSLLKKVESLF